MKMYIQSQTNPVSSHDFLVIKLVLSIVLLGWTHVGAQDLEIAKPSPNLAVESSSAIEADDSTPNAASTGEDLVEVEGESSEVSPELTEEQEAAKARFLKLRKKLAKEMGEMRAANIRFMNDEDRSLAAKEKYWTHRNTSRRLMSEIFEVALDIARMMPDQEALTYLTAMIEHRLKYDFYDLNTRDAGLLLIDIGAKTNFRFPQLIFPATARAAVATGDFELAKGIFEAMNVEKMADADVRMSSTLDELEEQWKKDVELQKLDAEQDNNPRVLMVTTRGEATLELFINQAPSTVSNFIELVERGYYDGLDFYQVIDSLLAITGDDSGTGEGNSGKYIMDEHTREDARAGLAGSLVMAKRPSGAQGEFIPDSASAQFAILFLPISSVSKQQTVFGRVIDGMDAMSELRRVDPSKKKKKGEILLPPDRILSMKIIRRPDKLSEVKYNEHFGHNHGPGVTH